MEERITIKGSFNRMSPANYSEKAEIPVGWFVISFRWMPERKDRRKYHGKWFEIKSEHKKIYRVLRFAGNLSGTPNIDVPGDIVLDWVGWIDLYDREENVDEPLDLAIVRAPWWKLTYIGLSHPDPTYKHTVFLAILSVLLGLLSVLLAICLK